MKPIKKQTKVLVLDFDNCIVLDEVSGRGSEEAKDEAWKTVFPELPWELVSPIIEQAKTSIEGGRGDRRDIVAAVFATMGMPNNQTDVEERCEIFNRNVQRAVIEIGVSLPVREALERMAKRLPLYVNTATPRDAAIQSFKALNIDSFFKDVLGRPHTKIENLKEVIKREKILPHEMLFVDDQRSGAAAARAVGCNFVGMRTERNTAWHSREQKFSIIKSLTELEAIV